MARVVNIGHVVVKGMQFRTLDAASLTTAGIPGDRDFLLIDERGRIITKDLKRFIPWRASLEGTGEVLVLDGPSGQTIAGPAAGVSDVIELDYLGVRTLPARFVADTISNKLSAAVNQSVRIARVENTGDGVDVFPISLISTASVRDLGQRMGVEDLEPARFRANIEVDGIGAYEEESWEGRHLQVGEAVLEMLNPIPRCAVTAMNPITGVRDHNTVGALARYRSIVQMPKEFPPHWRGIPLAVYARVLKEGRVALGDEAVILP